MARNTTTRIALASVATLATGALAGTAAADLIEIADQNSSVQVDTSSSAGAYEWLVDGTNQLAQQWFWYRIGNTGGESSIDSLDQVGIAVTDTNPFSDDRDDTLSVLYRGNGLEIEISYRLRGGNFGSDESGLSEQVTVRNTTLSALDIRFFQYSDFELGDTANDDTVEIVAPNTARQTDGSGLSVVESVVTPVASRFEAGDAAGLLSRLMDGNPTTLTNEAGPSTGDVGWGFQWNRTLAAGESFIINKDKSIRVPGPAGLAALAVFGLAARRRRRD